MTEEQLAPRDQMKGGDHAMGGKLSTLAWTTGELNFFRQRHRRGGICLESCRWIVTLDAAARRSAERTEALLAALRTARVTIRALHGESEELWDVYQETSLEMRQNDR